MKNKWFYIVLVIGILFLVGFYIFFPNQPKIPEGYLEFARSEPLDSWEVGSFSSWFFDEDNIYFMGNQSVFGIHIWNWNNNKITSFIPPANIYFDSPFADTPIEDTILIGDEGSVYLYNFNNDEYDELAKGRVPVVHPSGKSIVYRLDDTWMIKDILNPEINNATRMVNIPVGDSVEYYYVKSVSFNSSGDGFIYTIRTFDYKKEAVDRVIYFDATTNTSQEIFQQRGIYSANWMPDDINIVIVAGLQDSKIILLNTETLCKTYHDLLDDIEGIYISPTGEHALFEFFAEHAYAVMDIEIIDSLFAIESETECE